MEHESSKNFDIYVLPTSHNIWKQLSCCTNDKIPNKCFYYSPYKYEMVTVRCRTVLIV